MPKSFLIIGKRFPPAYMMIEWCLLIDEGSLPSHIYFFYLGYKANSSDSLPTKFSFHYAMETFAHKRHSSVSPQATLNERMLLVNSSCESERYFHFRERIRIRWTMIIFQNYNGVISVPVFIYKQFISQLWSGPTTKLWETYTKFCSVFW